MRSSAEQAAGQHAPERYRFEGFEFDADTCELRHCGRALELWERPLRVLAHLIRHRHRVVPREELVCAVWPDVRVSAGSLTQAIWELRTALHDNAAARIIKTVRGRGYRFVAPIEPGAAPRPPVTSWQAALELRMKRLTPDDALAVLEFIDLLQNGRAPQAITSAV